MVALGLAAADGEAGAVDELVVAFEVCLGFLLVGSAARQGEAEYDGHDRDAAGPHCSH